MTLVEAISFDPYDGEFFVVQSMIVSDDKMVEQTTKNMKLSLGDRTEIKTTRFNMKTRKK